jgi:HEAT repeat protein
VSHPIVERLRSADPERRLGACRDAPDDPSAVLLTEALGEALGDPVRRALHSDQPRRRLGAALTWARIEPPPPRLLPALAEGLGARDGALRWAATRTLVEVGRLHGEVLPLLLGLAATHADPVVRRMAVHALRELAPDEPRVAEALLEATSDADRRARRAAYAALAGLLDPPERVFARLGEALRGEVDPASRRIASVALGRLGAAAPERVGPEALAALREAQRDASDADLRRGAERALRGIEAARRPGDAPRRGD